MSLAASPAASASTEPTTRAAASTTLLRRRQGSSVALDHPASGTSIFVLGAGGSAVGSAARRVPSRPTSARVAGRCRYAVSGHAAVPITPSPSAGLGPPTAMRSSPSGPASKLERPRARPARHPTDEDPNLIVKQHPSRPGDHHVGLFLLAVTMRHRTAKVRRVTNRLTPRSREPRCLRPNRPQPRVPDRYGILDLQQVHGRKTRHRRSPLADGALAGTLPPDPRPHQRRRAIEPPEAT